MNAILESDSSFMGRYPEYICWLVAKSWWTNLGLILPQVGVSCCVMTTIQNTNNIIIIILGNLENFYRLLWVIKVDK